MRQKTLPRFACCALLVSCLFAQGCWRREGFAALAPATYVGWDGVRWNICDDANRTRGIDSRPGGTVIVDDVTALQVVDKKSILAKNGSGKMFLIKVEEWGEDDVQSFSTETEWLDALKAAGIVNPKLGDPASFYK